VGVVVDVEVALGREVAHQDAGDAERKREQCGDLGDRVREAAQLDDAPAFEVQR
jgi:hypothetical protein